MVSPRTSVVASLALAVASSGCTSLLTARAIDAFATSLASADAEQLRTVTSERFEQHALRRPEAVDDFKVLNLPTGKSSVIQIEDVSDDLRHIVVEVGDDPEKREKLEYQLRREPGSRKWVVDDVFVTQSRPGGGPPVTQSVAEQMHLLLTVREFIEAWSTGGRDDVLAAASPELQQVLADLPPAYLQQLTAHVVDGSRGRGNRPEARLDGKNAVVAVPRSHGKLMLRLTLEGDKWRVDDVSVEAREGRAVASVREMSGALSTASRFLTAYSTGDRTGLSAVSTPSLYKNSLVAADLADVPLPVAALLAAKYDYRPHGERIDVVLPHGKSSYMLSLAPEQKGPKGQPAGQYRVDDVTIFEGETAQVKPLRALFTAQAVVEVFADALQARDRSRLSALSTTDLNERVWSRADDVVLHALPLPEIEAAEPRVVATVFRGPTAEITVTQGSRALTYVLRTGRDRMLVDDVLLPVSNRPNSLKANLDVLVPLYSFALGAHHNDIELLKQHSGAGLNRIVWSQTRTVPDIGFAVVEHLTMPIQSIKTGGEQSMIELGDGRRRTRVALLKEGPHFVVQDVQLTVGEGPGQQVEMLQTMRHLLASRNTFAGGAVPPQGRGVIQASGESL
jgi:hypothetical protein